MLNVVSKIDHIKEELVKIWNTKMIWVICKYNNRIKKFGLEPNEIRKINLTIDDDGALYNERINKMMLLKSGKINEQLMTNYNGIKMMNEDAVYFKLIEADTKKILDKFINHKRNNK